MEVLKTVGLFVAGVGVGIATVLEVQKRKELVKSNKELRREVSELRWAQKQAQTAEEKRKAQEDGRSNSQILRDMEELNRKNLMIYFDDRWFKQEDN